MADNQQLIYQWLKGAGLNPGAIAGIMGNLYIENSFNPADPNGGGDGGTSHGIAQWREGRWTALQNYAASKGKPVTDLQTQVEFLIIESKQRGNFDEVNTITDPAQAAAYWDSAFEVSDGSARASRIAAAKQIYASPLQSLTGVSLGDIWDGITGGVLHPPGSSLTGGISDMYDAFKGIGKLITNLLDPHFWKRAGLFTLGTALILWAAVKITGTEDTIKAGIAAGAKVAAA